MKFNLTLAKDEIHLTLTETLRLPEVQFPLFGSPGGPIPVDLLPQIESLVHQYLRGYVPNQA